MANILNHPILQQHRDLKMLVARLKTIAERNDPERKDPLWKEIPQVTK